MVPVTVKGGSKAFGVACTPCTVAVIKAAHNGFCLEVADNYSAYKILCGHLKYLTAWHNGDAHVNADLLKNFELLLTRDYIGNGTRNKKVARGKIKGEYCQGERIFLSDSARRVYDLLVPLVNSVKATERKDAGAV
jgi:hypothetical protein